MIGVLGVAPAEGSVHCAVPGDHGSNMDTKLIKVGSKVYLPVFVSGAIWRWVICMPVWVTAS